MNGYEKMSKYIKNRDEKILRDLLRQKYGSGKYRINNADEVHAYGTMPNSIVTGWYLVGSRKDVMRDLNIK